MDRNLRNYETNHALPFHDGPSMGIAAFAAYSNVTATTQALAVPVGTLASFARGIGAAERVSWQEWLPFATPVELPLVFRPHPSILHSRVLSVRRADNSSTPRSVLQVHDFLLRSSRRKVGGCSYVAPAIHGPRAPIRRSLPRFCAQFNRRGCPRYIRKDPYDNEAV